MTENTTTVLRRVRFSRGLSTINLSALAGISRMTLWRIEHGRLGPDGAHAHVRAGLERALGVPYDVLAAPDTENASAPKGEGAGVPLSPATTREVSDGV